MLHAVSSVKIRLPEMCYTSTWPTRLGVHGSPLGDGGFPDSEQEVVEVDLERLLRHATFPTAPNPLRVLGCQLRSLFLNWSGEIWVLFFFTTKQNENSHHVKTVGSSASKSDKVGGSPPIRQAKSHCPTGSTSEAAKETAQTVDSMRVHRRS